MFATTYNQKHYLGSVAVSRFGDGMTDIALFTFAFSLNPTPHLVMMVAALKILGGFGGSFFTPWVLRRVHDRIKLYRWLDMVRAGLVVLALFSPNIYVLFLVCVPVFLAEAGSGALSASVLQNLCNDENRLKLNSRYQYVSFGFDLAGRAAAALLLLAIPLQVLFLLDVLTFVLSAVILLSVSELVVPSSGRNALDMYVFVLKDKVQLNIVLLRLASLTTLSVFSLLATYRLAEITPLMDFQGIFSVWTQLSQEQVFSLLNGAFTICLSVATVLGAILIGKHVNIDLLPALAYFGLALLIVGLCFFAWRLTSMSGFALYCLGGALCASGTVVLRLYVQTTGHYLTPETMLSEVIATSDFFARIWQNGVTGIALFLISTTLNPAVLIVTAAFFTLAGVVPGITLGKRLNKHFHP